MRMLFFPAFADNHDLISMKLYELTVDKTKEEVEQEEEDEVTVPRVDNMQQFIGNAHSQIENTDISFAQTHICICPYICYIYACSGRGNSSLCNKVELLI